MGTNILKKNVISIGFCKINKMYAGFMQEQYKIALFTLFSYKNICIKKRKHITLQLKLNRIEEIT